MNNTITDDRFRRICLQKLARVNIVISATATLQQMYAVAPLSMQRHISTHKAFVAFDHDMKLAWRIINEAFSDYPNEQLCKCVAACSVVSNTTITDDNGSVECGYIIDHGACTYQEYYYIQFVTRIYPMGSAYYIHDTLPKSTAMYTNLTKPHSGYLSDFYDSQDIDTFIDTLPINSPLCEIVRSTHEFLTR